MRIKRVSIAGYRSLRRISFPVGQLTAFVGANGVGKTNLYRSLQLLQAAAAGTLARDIASEGGMESAFWAGERRRKDPVRISLGAEFETSSELTYRYGVEAGLVQLCAGAGFSFEPQIKEERITMGGRRPVSLLERRGPVVQTRDETGKRQPFTHDLLASETALASIEDRSHHPEIFSLRRAMLGWRFYHDLRTDAASRLRQPCLAVTTPTLASDGSDLAAVFATLAHIRQDTTDLDRAVGDAFPGARLVVPEPERTASFGLILPDHPKRVFEPAELSDGTLRFLALAGALLGYRQPPFIALNEPETSLHPELLDPLARLIASAAERSQVWVVTHSTTLADALDRHAGIRPLTVVKRDGATWIEGLRLAGEFPDEEDE